MLKVKVLRPLMLNGKRVEADQVLSLDAAMAVVVVDSGRGVLVDGRDAAFLRAEQKTAVARVMASLPKVQAAAPTEGPWIPVSGHRPSQWAGGLH